MIESKTNIDLAVTFTEKKQHLCMTDETIVYTMYNISKIGHNLQVARATEILLKCIADLNL